MKLMTIGFLRKPRRNVMKMLLIMKLTAFFLLAICLQPAAKSFSQNVTISAKNASLQTIFKQINKQTGYQFFYRDQLLKKAGHVSLDLKNVPVAEVLNACFRDLPVVYAIIENAIIIKEKTAEPVVGSTSDPLHPALTVKGVVKDDKGNALAGVSVIIKGTSRGTKTNAGGEFTIDAGKGDILEFSSVGYKKASVTVGENINISITLEPDIIAGNELVVTAYGRVRKGSLTDAVTSVSGEKLENRPIRTVTDGLIGLAPGLNIRMPSGAPESTPSINIRGFTSINSSAAPLVLVDGVERPIQDVNPNDVESISLLKDGASTAVYGSRAPYGILLITTKSGKTGKMSVNYSTNIRIGKMVMFPTQPGSPEWARYINIAQRNGQPNGSGTDGIDAITIQRMEAWLNKDWNNPAFDDLRTEFGPLAQSYIENGQFPTNNAGFKNWTREQSFATTKLYDAYFNKSDLSQQHNLNFSGGTEKLQYFSSFGYNDANGLLKGDLNYNKRYNLQTKLNFRATDWLDLRTDINYVRQQNQGPNYRAGSASDAGTGTIANYADIFGSMMQYFATPLKVPSGNAYSWILGAAGILGEGGLITNVRNDMVLNGGVTVRPLKFVELNADYAWRVSTTEYTKVDKIVYTELPDGTKIQNNRSANVSGISKTNGSQNYQFVKLSAQYRRSFAQSHNVLAQVGMQAEENKYQSLTGSRTNLFAQDVITALNGAASNPQTNDNLYDWATLGYYAVVTYDFRQKYLVKFAGRKDASSRFAEDARWGVFPSVSGAWNIARESFWPLTRWVSEFKPRASWSTSGDLTSVGASNYYTYLPTLNFAVSGSTLLGGNFANVATPPGLVSPQLTWAKPTVLDIGIDVTALSGRLNIVYDWYQRTVKDQIGPPNPVPAVLGSSAPQLNNSVSETRGWELSVGWNDHFKVARKPFSYDIRFNLSDYIGYVTEYRANTTGVRSGVWTRGELFGRNLVYDVSKIAQNTQDLNGGTLSGTYNYPGYVMYKDINGDGYINSGDGGFWYNTGDLVAYGFNYPRKSYSIIPSVSWNNISLSAVLEGVMQWTVYNNTEWVWGTRSGSDLGFFYTPAFKESTSLGYWSPDNTDAFFPAFNTGRDNATSRYSLNLSHLRIRNITVGYDLPGAWIERIGFKRANIYFSGENMGFIYSKSFIKYDPELLKSGVNGYPPLRYYSFGLNVSL